MQSRGSTSGKKHARRTKSSSTLAQSLNLIEKTAQSVKTSLDKRFDTSKTKLGDNQSCRSKSNGLKKNTQNEPSSKSELASEHKSDVIASNVKSQNEAMKKDNGGVYSGRQISSSECQSESLTSAKNLNNVIQGDKNLINTSRVHDQQKSFSITSVQGCSHGVRCDSNSDVNTNSVQECSHHSIQECSISVQSDMNNDVNTNSIQECPHSGQSDSNSIQECSQSVLSDSCSDVINSDNVPTALFYSETISSDKSTHNEHVCECTETGPSGSSCDACIGTGVTEKVQKRLCDFNDNVCNSSSDKDGVQLECKSCQNSLLHDSKYFKGHSVHKKDSKTSIYGHDGQNGSNVSMYGKDKQNVYNEDSNDSKIGDSRASSVHSMDHIDRNLSCIQCKISSHDSYHNHCEQSKSQEDVTDSIDKSVVFTLNNEGNDDITKDLSSLHDVRPHNHTSKTSGIDSSNPASKTQPDLTVQDFTHNASQDYFTFDRLENINEVFRDIIAEEQMMPRSRSSSRRDTMWTWHFDPNRADITFSDSESSESSGPMLSSMPSLERLAKSSSNLFMSFYSDSDEESNSSGTSSQSGTTTSFFKRTIGFLNIVK